MRGMMMEDEINLENYCDVLEMLKSSESHLLLGNGFNCSLGIKTDYYTIFQRMKNGYKKYARLDDLFDECNEDIEELLGKLNEQIKKGGEYDEFPKKYINDKIKLDFMKAASQIVREEIKNVYQKETRSIYLLLRKFTNYFTLNYDPFLYLLLMEFNKNNKVAITWQNRASSIQEDLDSQNDGIYTKLKNAYDRGDIKTTVDKQSVDMKMSQLTKKEFELTAARHFKDSKWPKKILRNTVDLLWEEKQDNPKDLEVYDGLFPEYSEKRSEISQQNNLFEKRTQNLFFLHGAFHIYNKNGRPYKITQTTHSSLYNKLWEIIQDENKEIICVLKSTDKLGEIKDSKNRRYLKKCYDKLGEIEGNLVIIGSSLSENDEHIFTKINENTKIKTIFYSSSKKSKNKYHSRLKELFPAKKIILFDRDTVSYKKPLI